LGENKRKSTRRMSITKQLSFLEVGRRNSANSKKRGPGELAGKGEKTGVCGTIENVNIGGGTVVKQRGEKVGEETMRTHPKTMSRPLQFLRPFPDKS